MRASFSQSTRASTRSVLLRSPSDSASDAPNVQKAQTNMNRESEIITKFVVTQHRQLLAWVANVKISRPTMGAGRAKRAGNRFDDNCARGISPGVLKLWR